jgi:hypothetical protein
MYNTGHSSHRVSASSSTSSFSPIQISNTISSASMSPAPIRPVPHHSAPLTPINAPVSAGANASVGYTGAEGYSSSGAVYSGNNYSSASAGQARQSAPVQAVLHHPAPLTPSNAPVSTGANTSVGYTGAEGYSSSGAVYSGNNYSSASAGQARQSAPVQTVEEIRGTRTVRVPVQKQVKVQVPVQKAVKTQVPVQRAVHGTKEVVTEVTVNKEKVETYTKMVPVQATRTVTVPTVEKRVQQVPTVNYVTEMQEKIDYVTEMKEEVKTVTEYETKTIPTVQRRVRTKYETVQDFPPQDAPDAGSSHSTYPAPIRPASPPPPTSASINFGNVLSNASGSAALSGGSHNILSNASGSAALSYGSSY